MLMAPLPTNKDGHIITSANFGDSFIVKIEYNTDKDGNKVADDVTDLPYTLHGPFVSIGEADKWIEEYPDFEEVEEITVLLINNVR